MCSPFKSHNWILATSIFSISNEMLSIDVFPFPHGLPRGICVSNNRNHTTIFSFVRLPETAHVVSFSHQKKTANCKLLLSPSCSLACLFRERLFPNQHRRRLQWCLPIPLNSSNAILPLLRGHCSGAMCFSLSHGLPISPFD